MQSDSGSSKPDASKKPANQSPEKSEKKESKRYLHEQSRVSSPLQPQTPKRTSMMQERLQMIC